MRLLIAGAAALLASGCVIVATDEGPDWSDDRDDLTRLYAVSVTPEAVTIRAPSSGCTNTASFEPKVDRKSSDRFSISFVRVREDYCKIVVPEGAELVYARSELGLPRDAEITVRNPVSR